MQELDHETIARMMIHAGGLVFVTLSLPALLRRATRAARLGLARVRGRMRPFAGRAWVIDGDTVIVNRTRVRLFGMDAPEMTQAGGAAARSHLIGLIGGEDVEVIPLEVDTYGRTVAIAKCAGLDLSRAMVRDGFARATPYWSWAYLGAEIGARRRRRGLWAAGRLRGIDDPRLHRRRAAGRRSR